MTDIFIQQQHPLSRRWGTLEDDGTSAWLYLSEPDKFRPVADAWVFNRVPAPPVPEVKDYRPGPPPAAVGYAGPDALCDDPGRHEWSLHWSPDGESIAVLRDGQPLALIARARRPGHSLLLARNGPWGSVWDEELWRATMESD